MKTVLHGTIGYFLNLKKQAIYINDFLSRLNGLWKLKTALILFCILLACMTNPVNGQHQIEDLNRGIVAVKTGETSVFISWRLLTADPDTISFNIYRGDARINELPVANSTNYIDSNAVEGARYHVASVIGGIENGRSDTV